MSNSDAIATVSATLQHLLSGVAASVTTKPPTLARGDAAVSQLNIFLYGVQVNSAFSNFPLPGAARSGEASPPPLALTLHYLLTAYGLNDDDISGQQVLGQAMLILHDHPLLSQADIDGIAPDSGLQNQVERVRITPQPMSLDDMSKLWTSFQSAEYRLSAAYQASVALIDSRRPARPALPVLRRGKEDRGADVSAASLPFISGIRFPNQKPAGEFGDLIVLLGERLGGDGVKVRFEHPLLPDPMFLAPEAGDSDSELAVRLPALADDPALGEKWPAGFYRLSLALERPGKPALTSNTVPLPLAPRILSVNLQSLPADAYQLRIECLPQILYAQRLSLLFGDRVLEADSREFPPDPPPRSLLHFAFTETRKKTYVLRLRVDGVDSIPLDLASGLPEFAANQKVML